jgi:hypothetical protein
MRRLTVPIPKMEPHPKIARYTNPRAVEGMAVNTSNMRAALPARP